MAKVRAEEAGLTRKLVQFYSGMEYARLPAEVVDKAKYVCLDYLSVCLRGSITPSSDAVIRVVKSLSPGGKSVIMGTTLRANPEYAALANGVSAHSLDMDDVNNEASLHPGAVVFPAVFSSADLTSVDGRKFITAVV
jgi:2-methylcitrate dehydratase PrpD